MSADYSNRRLDEEQFRHLDHAIDLMRTHGWRYAVTYLRNQCIPDATIQRVLFGEWQHRRAPANKLIVRHGMASG